MKSLRIQFIQAKVYSLEMKQKEEALFVEVLRGTEEIMDFYDLVNRPPLNTSNAK